MSLDGRRENEAGFQAALAAEGAYLPSTDRDGVWLGGHSWETEVRRMAKDPATSAWLLESTVRLLKRDPLDAMVDAQWLARVMLARYRAVAGG